MEGVIEGKSGRWRYCFEGKELEKGTAGKEGSERLLAGRGEGGKADIEGR